MHLDATQQKCVARADHCWPLSRGRTLCSIGAWCRQFAAPLPLRVEGRPSPSLPIRPAPGRVHTSQDDPSDPSALRFCPRVRVGGADACALSSTGVVSSPPLHPIPAWQRIGAGRRCRGPLGLSVRPTIGYDVRTSVKRGGLIPVPGLGLVAGVTHPVPPA